MGEQARRDDELGPEGMKKAKGTEYGEDAEGHMRLREIDPEGLKAREWDEDTEGHMRVRASDGPEMEPDGLRRAVDDEDAEGHLRR